MNKLLLPLALLSCAGTAAAQGTATVFGTIDLGAARIASSSGTVNGLSSGGANISRLGFRGTEDLGGGLSASFWLEGGLDPDTGTGKAAGAFSFNRRSTVSASGAFGEVRLGRDDSATFLNTLIFDPFLTNGVGGTMAFVMRTGAPIIQISNAASYFLPANLGGFYGQMQYAFGEAAIKRQGNYQGLRGGYRNKELNVAAAAGKLNGATADADIKLGNLGVTYDFGVARPMLLWASEKQGPTQVSVVQLGVVVPLGAGLVRAQIGRYDTSDSATPAIDANDWRKLAVGYGYNLSTRTQLYGTVARVSNGSGAQKAISVQGLVGPATALGSNSSGYEVGMRHFF